MVKFTFDFLKLWYSENGMGAANFYRSHRCNQSQPKSNSSERNTQNGIHH